MLRDKQESDPLCSAHPCPIATFLFMSPVVSLLLGKTVFYKNETSQLQHQVWK